MDITPVDPTEALPVIRAYYADIIGRYHGRPATPAEIEQTMRDEPSDDLVMLIACDGNEILGCVGLDFHIPPFAEVKRMYVLPAARGRGVGQALLAAAEKVAREHDAVTMRLDTRRDLVEAIALYRKVGYVEVEQFSEGMYIDHSFAKDLVYVTAAEPDDIRLKALIAELDQELRGRYNDEAIGPMPITSEVRFALAFRGQEPIGCVAVQPKGDVDFELKRMFVLPAARGTGIAPLLLDAAEATVRAAGARRIVLETGIRQPEAIRLYEKFGYTRIPNFPPYDKDPLSVCYAKVVSD